MKISDLQFDTKNANKGTIRGRKAVQTSLQKFGAGRSVLIDRDGNIIAGNKTVEQAAAAGVDVIVVQTDGTKLVAVQRVDLSLDDPKARALAVADNRTAELGIEWDANVMAGFSANELDLKPFFTDSELNEITGADVPEPDDADAEWEGMPDSNNQDVAKRHLTLHFRSDADVQLFADLIQQQITDKTKYIWYPEEKPIVAKTTKYVVNE